VNLQSIRLYVNQKTFIARKLLYAYFGKLFSSGPYPWLKGYLHHFPVFGGIREANGMTAGSRLAPMGPGNAGACRQGRMMSSVSRILDARARPTKG